MLVGLTKSQIALVSAVFIFTLFGAMLVAWGLRRWNVKALAPPTSRHRSQTAPNR